jgi:hypothetical protein
VLGLTDCPFWHQEGPVLVTGWDLLIALLRETGGVLLIALGDCPIFDTSVVVYWVDTSCRMRSASFVEYRNWGETHSPFSHRCENSLCANFEIGNWGETHL